MQEFEFRLPVHLRPGGLAYLLGEVRSCDEELADDLCKPVPCLLVQPAALERILPQLVQVSRQTQDGIGLLEKRDEPQHRYIDPRMVPECVFAPRPQFTVELDQRLGPRRHAHLKRKNHPRIAVPRPDFVDFADVEDRGVDREGILGRDHALMYARRDHEPLEEIAVENCFPEQRRDGGVPDNGRDEPVKLFAQALVQREVILEPFTPLPAELHHVALQPVVVIPEGGHGIPRDVERHADPPQPSGA